MFRNRTIGRRAFQTDRRNPNMDCTTPLSGNEASSYQESRAMKTYRAASTAIGTLLLCLGAGIAQADDGGSPQYDPARYPDWSGPMRWTTTRGGNRYDQYKPAGRGQAAPLTAEYQAKFEAGLKDQAEGGQGANQTFACLPGGLPRDMAGNQGLEFLVTPKT